MGVRGYAFVSADNKTGVAELADALTLVEHKIISMGGTAKEITGRSIEVISPLDFLNDRALATSVENLAERERRDVVGAHLAQTMSQHPEVLRYHGRPVIDVVYVNPRKPRLLTNEHGDYAGVQIDKGGIPMLQAATEGGRAVLAEPEAIPDFVTFLKTNKRPPGGEASQRMAMSARVLSFLVLYHLEAYQLATTGTQ